MQLVDAHCHLESGEFSGILDSVIADAKQAGVVKLVTAAIVPEQWTCSAAIARAYPEVEFALGVHPWYARPEHLDALDELGGAGARGAVAIGEIGLDTKVETPLFALQQTLFKAQLVIAKEIDLPVVLHCRGAFNELLRYLKEVGVSKRGGLIHNYSGSVELARQFAAYGLSFSLGGVLTYRNSRKKREVLQAVYPERLLLETDSPDIPPVEAKDRPNVPANLVYNLRAAAEILGRDEQSVAAQTSENAARLFHLSL